MDCFYHKKKTLKIEPENRIQQEERFIIFSKTNHFNKNKEIVFFFFFFAFKIKFLPLSIIISNDKTFLPLLFHFFF